jgi:hypothetical protein
MERKGKHSAAYPPVAVRHSLEIKQFAQERPTLFLLRIPRIVFTTIAVVLIIVIVIMPISSQWCSRDRGHRPFDNLVQLTAIQPNTTALRAIIDFHTLPFCHNQIHFSTCWTLHFDFSLTILITLSLGPTPDLLAQLPRLTAQVNYYRLKGGSLEGD